MANAKDGDFVEISYTAKIAEDGTIFDTTDKSVAEQEQLPQTKAVILCVGKGRMMKGLEEQLAGKEVGKEHEINISAEKGFGKKSAQLIQLINTAKFRKENIVPQPGMQVDVDGHAGIVKTVTGGRTIVDFNHPLAGKDLVYSLTLKRIVTDPAEQVKAVLSNVGIAFEAAVAEGVVTLTGPQEPPEELKKFISDEIKEQVSSAKEVKFAVKAK